MSLLAVVALGACGGGDRRLTDGDSAPAAMAGLTADSGAYPAIDYELTSDNYRRWLAAQQALDTVPGVSLPAQVSMRHFDEGDVRQVVRYLEANPRASAAIASAGMSVEDFVKTSVALEQSMAATAGDAAPDGQRVAFRDIPQGNVALVRRERDDLRRTWDARRVRVVRAGDDSDHDSDDSDHDRGEHRGKGRHKEKGHGKGRGH